MTAIKNKKMNLDGFLKYAKEQFDCDVFVKPCDEADPFVQIFGTSFLNQDIADTKHTY